MEIKALPVPLEHRPLISYGILIAFTLALITLLTTIARSGISGTKESHFNVYSHGFRIGKVTSSNSLSADAASNTLKYSSSANINAYFIVSSYTLETYEEALIAKEGTLRYSRSNTENGHSSHVEGILENNAFVVTVTENNASRVFTFPRGDFDYTTMECPELHIKKAGDKMSARLLDLETVEIVTRRYTWVRSEEIPVGPVKYNFRVIDFEDRNKKCRRWIRPDAIGAMVARQDGHGKFGSYSVRMVEYHAR